MHFKVCLLYMLSLFFIAFNILELLIMQNQLRCHEYETHIAAVDDTLLFFD